MAVKFASSRKGGVQDLFHRRSGGGGSVSSRRSRSSISSSKSKRSSNKRRGRQSSNSRRSRSRSRSRTRSSSKQRQRRHRDENNNTNNLIVNKSFEQKLTQDVESMSASQQRHLNSRRTNTTKQHKRRHTADSTTTKSTKSSSTAPTYCHDGIDLLFSDVISPLSGAICTFLTACLCDDNLIDNGDDVKDERHLHKVSSSNGVNRQIVNRRIPQRPRRDEKILGSNNRRRVSPTVNGVVLKQEEYNVLQPIEGASAVVVEEEEVIMYY